MKRFWEKRLQTFDNDKSVEIEVIKKSLSSLSEKIQALQAAKKERRK